MGFIGISEAAAGTAGASNTILQTFGSLIAIAIGMVVGAGISRDFTAVVHGWKQPSEVPGGAGQGSHARDRSPAGEPSELHGTGDQGSATFSSDGTKGTGSQSPHPPAGPRGTTPTQAS